MRRLISACLVVLCSSLVHLAAGSASAEQANAKLVIGAIEVTGARRYTAAEVTRLSGLQPGQTVAAADLDAAVQRMAATGLFKLLNYRYASPGGRTTVTLEIQESDWTMPVVFDNFVWFKDEELIAALRQTIPSFDGTAPVADGVSDFITRELQKLLEARKIPGRVGFVPQGTLGKGIESFAFSVADPGPKLCAIGFPGASAIQESELAAVFSAVLGTDYSRSYVAAASRGTLVNLYRRRGHWRARIGAPSATVVSGSPCAGVTVALNVEEGPAYAWDRAEWAGNAAIAPGDLDALMAIKSGDVASVVRLDDGLRRVQKAYGKLGYIGQRATYAPRLDDAARKAVFAIKIEEGLQFRAGSITFPGLAPADAASLAKRWQLRPGDVFDSSYPDRFYLEEIRPRLPAGAKPPSMESQVDEPNRTVHVRFVFGK